MDNHEYKGNCLQKTCFSFSSEFESKNVVNVYSFSQWLSAPCNQIFLLEIQRLLFSGSGVSVLFWYSHGLDEGFLSMEIRLVVDVNFHLGVPR
jgi:hypothetical protein